MAVSHVFSHFQWGHTDLPIVADGGLVVVLVATLKPLKKTICDASFRHDER